MSDDLPFLRQMLQDPAKQHIRDIIQRRIFAVEFDIPFTNPFSETDEVLYQIGGRQ